VGVSLLLSQHPFLVQSVFLWGWVWSITISSLGREKSLVDSIVKGGGTIFLVKF